MAHPEDIESLITIHKKPAWTFYPAWILLTVLGIPVAFFLTLVCLRVAINWVGDYVYVDGVRRITEDYLAVYFYIPLAGLLTGLLQYALLRRYLPRMAGWVLGVVLIAFLTRLGWTETPVPIDLMFLLMGFSIGAAQWLLLRQRLPRAGWWIAANLLGWGLLGLITPGKALNQYGLFVLGFLPACATALGLAWLMSQVTPADPQAG